MPNYRDVTSRDLQGPEPKLANLGISRRWTASLIVATAIVKNCCSMGVTYKTI